jgi:putative ABC transport system ATP-binding protein
MHDQSTPPNASLAGPESAGRETVVTAENVSRRYGSEDTAVDALDNVSVGFQRKTLTAVMGPSGSGKSTLMHILAGLDRPTAGTVTIDGEDITRMRDKQLTLLRRRRLGFVFQFFNLLPTLTAEENILLPLRIAGIRPDRARFDGLVEKMRLKDRLHHHPSELSGGQQQRVAIARALINNPSVVFADEPTGNLDSTAAADVLALLRQAVDDLGHTIVVVTHEPSAAATADRILFLSDGRVVRDEGPKSVDQILDAMKVLS